MKNFGALTKFTISIVLLLLGVATFSVDLPFKVSEPYASGMMETIIRAVGVALIFLGRDIWVTIDK
jgi:hypothetical protein